MSQFLPATYNRNEREKRKKICVYKHEKLYTLFLLSGALPFHRYRNEEKSYFEFDKRYKIIFTEYIWKKAKKYLCLPQRR